MKTLLDSLNLGELIEQQLAIQHKSKYWLAKECSMDLSYLCKRLRDNNIDINFLALVTEKLNYNFFSQCHDHIMNQMNITE